MNKTLRRFGFAIFPDVSGQRRIRKQPIGLFPRKCFTLLLILKML